MYARTASSMSTPAITPINTPSAMTNSMPAEKNTNRKTVRQHGQFMAGVRGTTPLKELEIAEVSWFADAVTD
jgi:hypothetical protein